MQEASQYIVAGIILTFSILEILGKILQNTKRSKQDFIQEFVSFGLLSIFIKPGIVLLVVFLGNTLSPQLASTLTTTNFWLLLISYLLIDDLLQYWYHRSAHEYAFLWKLHRPHHAAKEMGLLVSYRNAALYYLLMPNIWWIALFTFLGGGEAVAVGLILKQLVIVGSHSTTRWDRILYRYEVLKPLTWVVERVFVTPAFHFAHHGVSKADGISDPNGNFGNMFAFWDNLFGTAVYSRKYPKDFGLQVDTNDQWHEHVFYPILSSKDPKSEISKGYKKLSSAALEPVSLGLETGNYLWCSCGFSKTQPFCDGSHHGTKFKPVLIKVEKARDYYLCNCKQSKQGPICDGTHKALSKTQTWS